MKKTLLGLLSLFLLFILACHSNDSSVASETKKDSTYAIIGKVTGQDSGTIYLLHRQNGKTDSTNLDHGFFKFSGKADTAEYCRISLNDQTKSFFLENGKISMLITRDSLRQAQITGTRVQEEFNYFENQFSKTLNDKMKALDKAYDEANKNKNQKVMDSLEKAYEILGAEQKQLVIEYAKTHPASILAAFEIYYNFLYDFRLGQLDSAYHLLDSATRETYFGRQIQTTIEKTKLTSVGSPAPDFTSDDIKGKPVSLSSFKGNFVLVDFWASWCGPCRRENPAVVRAYQQFHGKGFNILGVSLDDTRSAWLAAIKKDRLDWTQVSQLKGWDADVVTLYGIKAIPMNFLLDKNGVIVARGLRGEDLSNKLNELLH
jgi:thiol-disulfide isomerase/thioredoxin